MAPALVTECVALAPSVAHATPATLVPQTQQQNFEAMETLCGNVRRGLEP